MVESSNIVQAVVNIAAERNITTTAEGVETEQQRRLLRTLGCTEMQGYLFSPARPAAELKEPFAARSDRGAAAKPGAPTSARRQRQRFPRNKTATDGFFDRRPRQMIAKPAKTANAPR